MCPKVDAVPRLMDPPIMTIAYAGTIKLSKEGCRRTVENQARHFFSFCGKRNDGETTLTHADDAETQIEIAIRNNTSKPFVVLFNVKILLSTVSAPLNKSHVAMILK